MIKGILPFHRIFYHMSIAFCTQSAMRSVEVLNEVFAHLENPEIENPYADIENESVLDELQNVVLQAAAINRYFWPSHDRTEIHMLRAEDLKKEFDIDEKNPLRLSKALRDAIEHFDERLDRFLASNMAGQFFPHYFGPDFQRNGVPIHFFRSYFTDTGIFEMLGHRCEIEPIAKEIWRIDQKLRPIAN